MTPVRALLAKNIAATRKARGLSQEALAELANTTHIHVSRIETGASWPTDAMLSRIAAALKTTASAFFVDPSAAGTIPPVAIERLAELAQALGCELRRPKGASRDAAGANLPKA